MHRPKTILHMTPMSLFMRDSNIHRSTGYLRYNESTGLTRRKTCHKALTLDLCVMLRRDEAKFWFWLPETQHTYFLSCLQTQQYLIITVMSVSNNACSLSSPWAWWLSRNISERDKERGCPYYKISLFGDMINGTPCIYLHKTSYWQLNTHS